MRLFIFALLLITFSSVAHAAKNLSYINGLYLNRNCEYFARELKKNWDNIPPEEKNEYLAKLADCSVDRGQLDFADSLFQNLEKKNFTSTILNQAKAKLNLSRNDFKKVTDDFELQKTTKGSFQYYISIAQAYYEQEQYDDSLKVLVYISPEGLTPLEKNVVRYWKAKDFFLKDDYEKANYFIDLILDTDEKDWVSDAAKELQSAVAKKHKMFHAIVYFNATYDDNTNKESVSNNITMDSNPNSYIHDGTYRVNPSLDFYLTKDVYVRKYINVDLNMSWSSVVTSNESEVYTLRYKESRKTSSENTLSWETGFAKTQTTFNDTGSEAFIKGGIFHRVSSDKFFTAFYRYGKDTVAPSKSEHSLSFSMFFVLTNSQLVYFTLTHNQNYDTPGYYTFDGTNTPFVATGTQFGSFGTSTIDLVHSIDLSDSRAFRTQFSISEIDYQNERLPSGAEGLTNSYAQRIDKTYSLTLAYSQKFSDAMSAEMFATVMKGTSQGFQGYLLDTFPNKNFTDDQLGINLDWTYE